MASSSAPFMFLALTLLSSFLALTAANLSQDFDITWGDGRGKIMNNGDLLSLSLDKASGSGFQSKNEFLFVKIDMQLKLVHGNSAGTVTAYDVSSLLLYLYLFLKTINISNLCSFELMCLLIYIRTVILKRIGMGRDRLRVLGESEWRSLHPSHQCLQPRQGQQRATVLSLVWRTQLLIFTPIPSFGTPSALCTFTNSFYPCIFLSTHLVVFLFP